MPQINFAGVVHSVFDQAVNIRLTDGHLATCTAADYFELPRGIRVATAHGFRFSSLLTNGAAAYCRGGILRFRGSNLKIDLRDAPVWQNDYTAATRPSRQRLHALWRVAVGQTTFGFDFPKQQSLALLAGLGSDDRRQVRQSLRGLIGRGPGLTPAGDDVIAGFLAAPKLMAPAQPWSRALGLFTLQYLQATNDISRQMLSDAAGGHFIEPILSTLSAIYGAGQIGRSTRRLRSVGGTSGAAMLLGLVAGIAHVEDYQLQKAAEVLEPVRSAGAY
ncbi:MAG: DUF2877 domain-containing protein [Proteobacteria bacterium]|nr:DUF2877 domain-containing protein [Pseudomonadota bacterium]